MREVLALIVTSSRSA